MAWSAVVEVVVGLSFVFFVLSLVCSGVKELIAAVLGLRGSNLRRGLVEMLGEEETAKLYDHPAISSLYRGRRLPSYLPPEKFALAVLDGYLGDAAVGPDADPAKVTAALAAGQGTGTLHRTLDLLWRDSNHDVAAFRAAVEGWFNDTMERVSGWYRRKAQYLLLGLGIALAVSLNVDTVTLAQRLWTDAPLRAALVEHAGNAEPQTGRTDDLEAAVERLERSYSALERLQLPMGWSGSAAPGRWYEGIPGWLLTGMALAMGAPFWFDLLNKAAGIRASGTRPEPVRPVQAADEAAAPKPS